MPGFVVRHLPHGNRNTRWLWNKLLKSAAFRARVVERVKQHFFGSGALTVPAAVERFSARRREIDRAVVAESARWGDAKKAVPFTRDDHWLPEINRIANEYVPRRTATVLGQLRAAGLAP